MRFSHNRLYPVNEEEIAKNILDYLRKNPDAGDTLEGICQWWIQSEFIDENVDKVADVLKSLNEEGLIKRQAIKGSHPIYRISKKD